MPLKRAVLLAATAACIITAARAQEQAASAPVPSDEVGWQKQCIDKADHDNLDKDLRATFMTECLAGAKLSNPVKP